MTIRHDVYVYNESNGLVFTYKAPKGRKSKAFDGIDSGNQFDSGHRTEADDPGAVRVIVDGILSTQEQDEWVECVTGRLKLLTNRLALCGGIDYVEDPQ